MVSRSAAAHDQAGDQREDDNRSLVFETPLLDEAVEILGAASSLSMSRPTGRWRTSRFDCAMCIPSGESLRVSYGILNLTHRDGHEAPSPLAPGQRYNVRIQLNDAGSVFPAGHRVRLALSTTYWPMIWPAPEKATRDGLRWRARSAGTSGPGRGRAVPPLPGPETATPERPTVIRAGCRAHRPHRPRARHARASSRSISRTTTRSAPSPRCGGPRRSAGDWQVRIETQMRLSCTRDAFLLRASLRAWEGSGEVCHREWDRSIPRDLS